jgi:hypothetical protein
MRLKTGTEMAYDNENRTPKDEQFDLDKWVKDQKEIHFPEATKPHKTNAERGFSLGLEWGFEKACEVILEEFNMHLAYCDFLTNDEANKMEQMLIKIIERVRG